MRIAVIGTVNRDTILLPDGTFWEAFGGILYNLVTLSNLSVEEVIVCPICNVGGDVFPWVDEFLSRFDRIDRAGVRRVEDMNNHATLTYRPHGEREEILRGSVPPIEFSQIEPFVEAEAILVNFVSGFDLSLDTMRQTREKSSALIFMDIHSLSLGIDDQGRRFLRHIPELMDWVGQADLVQLNHLEAETVWGRELRAIDEFLLFGKAVLDSGPRCLLITQGSVGSLLIQKREGRAELTNFPAAPGTKLPDTTGCGDIFSAAFLVEYLRSRDPILASRAANNSAGRKDETLGSPDLLRLTSISSDRFFPSSTKKLLPFSESFPYYGR